MSSKLIKETFMFGLNINGDLKITVSFPALADLVAYLQARESAQIDALSSTLTKAREGLKQSSTDLESVETKENR